MIGPHRHVAPYLLSSLIVFASVGTAVPSWASGASSSREARTSTGAAASSTSASHGPQSSSAVPDLGGWWAQKMVLTAVSDPPFVGKVINETINYLLIRVTQEGRDLTLHSQVCDVEIDSSFKKVETILPPAFAEALPDSKRRGELVRGDGQWRVQVDRLLSVVGARLREPTSERLPTTTDDPRVVDADEDGHPGLTVKIRGMVNGRLYVVQRGWDAYSGTIADPERIRGDVRWSTEQTVLGSNNIFLRSQPPTEPHDDPDRSFFEMVRLDGSPSCSDVSPQLFKG